MNYWPLLGVATVVLGFLLRLNAMIVVIASGVVSGLAAGLSIPDLLALLGESFVSNRSPLLIILTLPVIGLLEYAGLREHAQAWIARLRGLTLARLLIAYLGLRQLLSMIGLQHVCGHPQTVRPLLAPMAEGAAERQHPALSDSAREEVKALAAATDNVGLFFGEDVFVAIGAVLLIQGFYARSGIALEPISIALWAIPTALAAFAIHALRILAVQRRLARSEGSITPADGAHVDR
ncbi:MAG: DUF969 domain-containing protein [Tahibacter sp.]